MDDGLESQFASIDKNGDGFIDAEEAVAMSSGGEGEEQEIRDFHNTTDTDGDGQVSYEEYQEFANQQDSQYSDERTWRLCVRQWSGGSRSWRASRLQCACMSSAASARRRHGGTSSVRSACRGRERTRRDMSEP